MKILVLTYFYRNFGGGEGRVSYEIADNLAKNKENEIFLLAPGKVFGMHKEGPLNVITYKSVGDGDFTAQSMSWMGLRKIYKILQDVNPDIVHSHSFVPPVPNLIQIWAIQHQKPFLYTTHILPTKAVHFPGVDLLNMISPVLKIPLKEYIKTFYDNCSAVIALNKFAEDDVRKFGFKGHIQRIPNGRDLSLYSKLKINYSSGKIVLSYVGNINERKNQKFLIEAMRFLPSNYELRLIGPILSNDYYDEILKYIDKYKIENVKYLGKIPYEEIAGQLEESQIFVSAATMEVQSLVIIEAMASGTPVVGLSNETVDELIDPSVGIGLEKNASAKKFAEAILKIATLKESEYQKLATNSRDRVKDLDWSNVIKETEKFYEFCIANYNSFGDKNEGRVNRLLNAVFDEKFKSYYKKFLGKYSYKKTDSKPKRSVSKSLLILSVFLTIVSAMMYMTYSGVVATKKVFKK